MIDQHLITPPLELVREWANMFGGRHSDAEIFTKAVRWGADQELDACCQYINEARWFGNPTHRNDPLVELRAARRPKPPSLKEQALRELGDAYDKGKIDDTTYDSIKRALEALND